MPKHYLIFVHGIGKSELGRDNFDSYNTLWNLLIQKSGDALAFEQQFERIYTDWHTDPLETAARKIQESAFPGLEGQTFNPMRSIRNFMTFFMGDIIAYVSEDVNFIRRTVWEQIWEKLEQPLKQEDATYSIISHSLGSVIAFDYLFSLFYKSELFVPEPDPKLRSEDEGLQPIRLGKDEKEEKELLEKLRNQFRHFFTFGSPIGLFMMRKGSLWIDKDPPFQNLFNPVRNGRWYNFWDGQDPVAYPLVNLFDNQQNTGCHLEDILVNTGFLLIDSHTQYWKNREMAEKIVQCLKS